MSLNTMAQRLIMEVPGISSAYAVTLINEALGIIYDQQMWSFQLQVSGWLTGGLLFPGGSGQSQGTTTMTPYSTTVTADAVATAAWAAYTGRPFLTECQFRSPYYSLYSIIAYNPAGAPPFATLTLDRPWMEPGGAAQAYMIYQAFFPVPVPDFKRFIAARDTTNNAPMDYWSKSQKVLSVEDPQRTIFNNPGYIVPYQQDQRPNSATLGNMLYELWPNPLSVYPYTFNYLRRGNLLVKTTDTVPYPLTEEAVMWRAKECAYLWKEAQKGEEMQRGSGADFRFLAESSHDEYKQAMKPVRDRDRDLVELYWMKWRPDYYNNGQPFSTITGQLNVGRM